MVENTFKAKRKDDNEWIYGYYYQESKNSIDNIIHIIR
jgi:hypothetical protein